MRMFILVLLAFGIASPTLAQGKSCDVVAAEKKLAGAAKAEFLRQCVLAAKAQTTLAAKDNKKAAMSAGKDENCGHSAAADL